jgi:hypothetical protein
MKTAILLTGNVRTWDKTKDSFTSIFGNTADIFLATYNRRYNYHPYIQEQFGLWDDEILDNDRIFELFEGFNLKKIYIDDNSTDYKVPDGVDSRQKANESTYYQYLKFRQCVELMMQQEQEQGWQYDVAIKSRTDLIYVARNNVTIDVNAITIDTGNIFPNDHMFISKRDNIVAMSGFIMEEFYNPKFEDSHEVPPHRILHNSMKNFNLEIKQEKFVDYVLRKDDFRSYY